MLWQEVEERASPAHHLHAFCAQNGVLIDTQRGAVLTGECAPHCQGTGSGFVTGRSTNLSRRGDVFDGERVRLLTPEAPFPLCQFYHPEGALRLAGE